MSGCHVCIFIKFGGQEGGRIVRIGQGVDGNIASTSGNWLKLGMHIYIPTYMTHAKYQDDWGVGGWAKRCESWGQAGNIAPTSWNTMKLFKHVSMHVRISCTHFH
jgi:hypothetical protein